MEFNDLIRRRRMVRNYDPDKPVSRESLEQIAAAAQRAPSAGFSQGQRLVIVTDDATRHAIANAAGEPEYVQAGFDPWASRAPALIVPCVSEEIYHRRYNEPDKRPPGEPEIDWPVPFWWVDIGATWMLIMLAAIDEGLVTGFLGVYPLDDLREVLGIPAEFAPIGVVTIGYPLPDRKSGSLKRGWLPEAEFVRWERW
jgi:nitroreductase